MHRLLRRGRRRSSPRCRRRPRASPRRRCPPGASPTVRRRQPRSRAPRQRPGASSMRAHIRLLGAEVEVERGDLFLEPANGDKQPLEQRQRAGRTAGDVDVDGRDAIDRSVDERVLPPHRRPSAHAPTATVTFGSGTASSVFRTATSMARTAGPVIMHEVGVARRRREEEAEPVQVVVRCGQQADLRLADGARARVQGADVEAAPEHGQGTSGAARRPRRRRRSRDVAPDRDALHERTAIGRGELPGRPAVSAASPRPRGSGHSRCTLPGRARDGRRRAAGRRMRSSRRAGRPASVSARASGTPEASGARPSTHRVASG